MQIVLRAKFKLGWEYAKSNKSRFRFGKRSVNTNGSYLFISLSFGFVLIYRIARCRRSNGPAVGLQLVGAAIALTFPNMYHNHNDFEYLLDVLWFRIAQPTAHHIHMLIIRHQLKNYNSNYNDNIARIFTLIKTPERPFFAANATKRTKCKAMENAKF